MKQSVIALSLVGAALARPGVNNFNFEKREVPQEHAHRNVNLEVSKSLNANNPDKIGDPIFGLLGAKAAAEGAGNIADTGMYMILDTAQIHRADSLRLPSASHCRSGLHQR